MRSASKDQGSYLVYNYLIDGSKFFRIRRSLKISCSNPQTDQFIGNASFIVCLFPTLANRYIVDLARKARGLTAFAIME